MSKALIVGAAGFVGSYLAREVKDHHGMEVHATKLAMNSWRYREWRFMT